MSRSQAGSRFEQGEMTEFVLQQKSESLDAISLLYTVFHLPRVVHVKLFAGIFEALKPGGSLLVTLSPHAAETYEDEWLGTSSRMYWSQVCVHRFPPFVMGLLRWRHCSFRRPGMRSPSESSASNCSVSNSLRKSSCPGTNPNGSSSSKSRKIF